MADSISFKLNDQSVRLNVDGDRPLLWVLRTDLGLTGTKFGCGEGHCGCCTVLVNKTAARSCKLTVKDVDGKEVTTIEGLEKNGKLHPLQKAFVACDAMQCGFCIPGQIMTGVSLLNKSTSLSEAEIIRGMNRNLCRCGVHKRIVEAVQIAATEMKGGAR